MKHIVFTVFILLLVFDAAFVYDSMNSSPISIANAEWWPWNGKTCPTSANSTCPLICEGAIGSPSWDQTHNTYVIKIVYGGRAGCTIGGSYKTCVVATGIFKNCNHCENTKGACGDLELPSALSLQHRLGGRPYVTGGNCIRTSTPCAKGC